MEVGRGGDSRGSPSEETADFKTAVRTIPSASSGQTAQFHTLPSASSEENEL